MSKLINLRNEQIHQFIWIFYAVGIVGLGIPWSRSLFIDLVPVHLLVSFVALVIKDDSDQKLLIPYAILVFVSAFIIEAVGVNTGFLFGDFTFGKSLGPKIFKTPVVIGFIWIMLVYCSSIIVSRFTENLYFKSFLATVLIVVYDMVLEGPAGIMDMWSWDWAHTPMRNYLTWFIIAWAFNGALQMRKIKLANPVAPTLFTAQFVFFLLLNIVFFAEQAIQQ